MYKAEILGSLIENGMLTVQVQYSNGTDTFVDVIQTSQKQDDTWLNTMIARKLKELQGLTDMLPSVKPGPVDVSPESAQKPAPALSAKEQYKNDLARFNKFLDAMRAGAVDDQNAQFIALRDKLKKNFDVSYLDLF